MGGTQLMPRRYTAKLVVARTSLAALFLLISLDMTLRISTRREDGREVVMVDGRVDADVVAELERVVA
jgi:hypothetical protein